MAKRELNKKTSELKVTVEGKKSDWHARQESAKRKLLDNLEIDGFRKGKAPEDIAIKHIKSADIWQKALPSMLNILIKEAAKEIKKDEIVLDSPFYNLSKLTADEIVVEFIYPVYPEINMVDYKKLKTKFKTPTVDAKLVEKEIKNLQKMHSLSSTVDRVAKNGDIVKFDFVGFVDGKQFQGGKAENHELELGSGQFIPGFEKQLEGTKKGDKKEVLVTFPEEYQSPELKGKKATFKCVIHEVKEKTIPEFNDDLAKEVNAPGIKTAKELKVYIKDVLTQQANQKARLEFKDAIFAEITKATELIVPSALIIKEINNQEKQFVEAMQKQGITKEAYMQMTGMDSAAFKSQMKSAAEKSLKDSLIFAEIAKLEKIKLTDNDYEKEYEKLTKVYGQSLESIKATIQKTQMQIPMTNEKVIDILIAANK